MDFFTFDKPAPLWGLFFFRELFLLWRAFLLWRQPPGDKLFADWGPVGVMAIGREVDGGGDFYLGDWILLCNFAGRKRTVDKFGCLQPPKKMLKPHFPAYYPLFLLFLFINMHLWCAWHC
ncbi:MAG: hypothetical protein HDS77_08310 [Bacteroidales bacterium]|nr:hypothetical protein [Bacteroidales bacterium]